MARILCERLHPDDLASVLDAQSLLGGAAPPADGSAGYHRGIARTADQTVARLEELRDSNPDVTSESIQTVRVAQYALRYRDVEAGRKYVLGSDANAEEESGWRGSLSPSWQYSVNTGDGTEFYVHGDRQIELHQEEEGTSYSTRFLHDGELIEEARFHRYGEANRMVKRWVTDPPETEYALPAKKQRASLSAGCPTVSRVSARGLPGSSRAFAEVVGEPASGEGAGAEVGAATARGIAALVSVSPARPPW